MNPLLVDVRRGKVPQVLEAVRRLDDASRKALRVEMAAWVREEGDFTWHSATCLAVVVVATMPTAGTAAAVLNRRAVELTVNAAEPVLAVARERGVTWLPELAYRLAPKIGRSGAPAWAFVAAVLAAEGAPPPDVDGFVEAWLGRVDVADLAADPFLDAVLPRLFTLDGVGALFPRSLPAALAELDRLDRTILLDGCLGRLLRGDRPAALRPFVALHDLLAPSAGEIASRVPVYLRLLADGSLMAQRTLRGVGDVDLDSLLEASRAMLVRPEKAPVRAQLTWLDQLARQMASRAPDIAAVLAVAADHPAAELRDRAAALAAKHGFVATPRAVVVGGDELPSPPPVAPAPPPITDPDELAEEVVVLLSGSYPALVLERVLDGLVRLPVEDLRKALPPVVRRYREEHYEHRYDPLCICDLLIRVLDAGVSLRRRSGSGRPGFWGGMAAAVRRRRPPAPDPRVPPVQRLVKARLTEVGALLGDAEPGLVGVARPGLVAAPTWANGALDAEVLLDRLARVAEPWPWDLTQALLRLPARVDEPLARRAAALRTPAGRRLAGWLRAGGLPAPTQEVVTGIRDDREVNFGWLSFDRLMVTLTPPGSVTLTPPGSVDLGLSGSVDLDPVGLLSAVPAPHGVWYGSGISLWPAALPGYRGLVAAYVLADVASSADHDLRGGAATLPMLAELTGDGGPALALAVAYGLGARHEQDRIAAVDALLALAAAGDLDAPAVGGYVGALHKTGTFSLPRVVQPLRDAAEAGAGLSVWRLLAAALPHVLDAGRGTPDLLTLAAETAAATGVRLDVPGLAEVASRGGSSRVVVEALRLTRALGGGA